MRRGCHRAEATGGADSEEPPTRGDCGRHSARDRHSPQHRVRADRGAPSDRGALCVGRPDRDLRPCGLVASARRFAGCRGRRAGRLIDRRPGCRGFGRLRDVGARAGDPFGGDVPAPRVLQARVPGELPVQADPRRLRRRTGAGHSRQSGREDARSEDRLGRRVRRQSGRADNRARNGEHDLRAHLDRLGRDPAPRQALPRRRAVGPGGARARHGRGHDRRSG